MYGSVGHESMWASCKQLGGTFGVGYGLYFKELRWWVAALRGAVVWLY